MNRVYTAGTELRARINRHKNKNIYLHRIQERRYARSVVPLTLCFQTENVFCGSVTASRLFPSVPLFH